MLEPTRDSNLPPAALKLAETSGESGKD